MSVVVSNKDEIIMQLVHYFVTEEDYEPIPQYHVQLHGTRNLRARLEARVPCDQP